MPHSLLHCAHYLSITIFLPLFLRLLKLHRSILFWTFSTIAITSMNCNKITLALNHVGLISRVTRDVNDYSETLSNRLFASRINYQYIEFVGR